MFNFRKNVNDVLFILVYLSFKCNLIIRILIVEIYSVVNEIKTLHPKLLPSQTSSNLATAQGSILTNYGKSQLLLASTRTMEQIKLKNKTFKQTFHIIDIKTHFVAYHLLLNIYPLLVCVFISICDVKCFFEKFIQKFNLFHCSSGSEKLWIFFIVC